MADGVAACRTLAQSDLSPTMVRLYDAEGNPLASVQSDQLGRFAERAVDGGPGDERRSGVDRQAGHVDAVERVVGDQEPTLLLDRFPRPYPILLWFTPAYGPDRNRFR